MRRIAKTIEDVKELLGDYDTGVALDGEAVHVTFPDMEKYKPTHHPDKYKPWTKPDEASQFTEDTRCVIREMVSSPQFWRMTTVVDQLHSFVYFHDGKKKHGAVKLEKKGGVPPKITFDSAKTAKKFYKFMTKPIDSWPKRIIGHLIKTEEK